MIKVLFGYSEDSILNIDEYFNNVYENDWLDDDFVKNMIKVIDNSTVLSNQCIQSSVLCQIPPERLSGGVKALICLWKMSIEDFDGLYIDLMVCGENCEDFILDIGRKKDILVSMTSFDLVFKNKSINGVCLNDGDAITNWKDWHNKAVTFIEESVDL